MAVTAISGAASADTWPAQVAVAPRAESAKPKDDDAVKPRLLPSGAPACGNVMFKSYQPRREDALCPVIRNLRDLAELGRKWQAILDDEAALTLEPPSRPRL